MEAWSRYLIYEDGAQAIRWDKWQAPQAIQRCLSWGDAEANRGGCSRQEEGGDNAVLVQVEEYWKLVSHSNVCKRQPLRMRVFYEPSTRESALGMGCTQSTKPTRTPCMPAGRPLTGRHVGHPVSKKIWLGATLPTSDTEALVRSPLPMFPPPKAA
jgi:hypothetical protein